MKWAWKRNKVVILLGVFSAITAVLVFAVFAIYHAVTTAGSGKIYTIKDDVPARQVALVLGARVYKNGRLSPVLADRVDTAITLYDRGVVKKLLMSGDNRRENYNEVTAMRDYAIERGVPSDDVVRDFAGFRTYDSLYRARELWDLDELIIVSQQFHLPRSMYIAEKLGIDAIGVVAEGRYYPRSLRRASRREVGARLLAWIDIQVGRDPYFLGPRESLSGDTQATRVGD